MNKDVSKNCPPTYKRIFVANRGEIALRIIRAAHALDIETVLGVSEIDRDSAAAREAGRVLILGPNSSRDSYLKLESIVHAACATECTALHPGYGFLSERADFAELCAKTGIAFIGPSAASISSVGDKLSAKKLAESAGVPLTPGSGKVTTADEAVSVAKKIGYPVITKASAGGGGRGMIIANSEQELRDAFDQATATAREAFGDDTLYLERFVKRARHLEVQAIGDGTGNVVHFGERDCTIQRRYQKMIEEAPASVLSDSVRASLRQSAIDLLSSIQYRNAGTVEFLYDADREDFFFMETNARIQVEHPVSEEISGFDLIKMQIETAVNDRPLPTQNEVKLSGHAIEARILAEDPNNNFSPSPGQITRWIPPAGPGVRVDSGVVTGSFVPPFYDSMIAKLIVRGHDRNHAIDRLIAAVDKFRIEGIATNLPLLKAIIGHDDFRSNNVTTRWLENSLLPSFSA